MYGKKQKGRVHSSHIKYKGVLLTQINWKELANFLKNVEKHPSREPKYVSALLWMLLYIYQEMDKLLPVNLCYFNTFN